MRCRRVDESRYYEKEYSRRDAVGFEESVAVPVKVKNMVSLLRDRGAPDPVSILEVGCGEGYVFREIAASFRPLVMVGHDISYSALEKARSLIEGGAFLQGDADMLPVKDDSFDLVMLVDVLEHLPDPVTALRKAMLSAQQALVKSPLENNLWGLTFRWVVEPLLRILRRMMRKDRDQTSDYFNPHIQLFSERGLVRVIEEAGGTIIGSKRTGYPWDPDYDEDLERIKLEMYRKAGLLNDFPRYYLLFNRYSLPRIRRCVKDLIGKISPDLYSRCFHTHLYLLVEKDVKRAG